MQTLKHVLQILALPVTGQVHLVKNDCSRVELLARAFNAAHHAVLLDIDKPLTSNQSHVLLRLDDQLAQAGRRLPAPICSELSMRKSPEWRQIRNLARESLVRFGWPLEVPLPAIPALNHNQLPLPPSRQSHSG